MVAYTKLEAVTALILDQDEVPKQARIFLRRTWPYIAVQRRLEPLGPWSHQSRRPSDVRAHRCGTNVSPPQRGRCAACGRSTVAGYWSHVLGDTAQTGVHKKGLR